ncbi:beta-propeller fold lactonase family protein [Streptomyces sp. RB17]|uniref:YVTN family beta-propeller repeat protein n=1 Tax=Streptomyces sp. RB17 TaxID=2585197 RepID=UPI001297F47B|nr:beta-propeller fold lactonase family protein [Streptomyces sp. RB17]
MSDLQSVDGNTGIASDGRSNREAEVPVLRRKSKQGGSYYGSGPEKGQHGRRPWSWAWLRACMAGLAMLTGLALPVLASSSAWAAPGPNAYVANFASNTVSVIDTASNTVVGSPVPVGTNPAGVAITPDGRHAYVTNQTSNDVSVIDTASNTVVGSPIPVGTNPFGIAITPDGRHAYVTNFGSNQVSVIDTASNTVVDTIPVGTFPLGIAITPDGRHAYVTNRVSGDVSVIDTASNTVVGSPIPVGVGPLGIAITPDGRHAYVANTDSNTVSVIDTASNTVVDTIPVGGGPQFIAITPDGSHAYVTDGGSNTVSVIDTASNTVVGSPIPVGSDPYGVAIAPDGRHAYVANQTSNTVSVIDTASNTVVGSPIPVGTLPAGIAITPVRQPSLTITKHHTGNFHVGRLGTYTITVGNNGSAPTNGTTVTVHDTLPRGLTAVSITGSGWNCTRSTLTCTRSNALPAGSSYPPISLTVRALGFAPSQVTNTVTVTGGGDTATHTTTDVTTITRDPASTQGYGDDDS